MMMLIHWARVLMDRYAPTYDIGMVMVISNLDSIAEIVVNSIASNIAVTPTIFIGIAKFVKKRRIEICLEVKQRI